MELLELPVSPGELLNVVLLAICLYLSYQLRCSKIELSHLFNPQKTSKPHAILCGAGPGDPSLLTLAAVRALRNADLVITDRLVSPEVLALCSGEIRFSQKFKGCANKAQAQLQDWVVEGLKSGKTVLRLKGGDPFLYGRGMEEVDHILNHGFSVKVINGISSVLAAPLAAGISVTERGVANRLLVATAHGKYDTYPDIPPYDFSTTTVYMMSVSRLRNLSAALIKKGYPDHTPVAIIENGTLPNQRSITSDLRGIARLAEARGIKSPAVIVIGQCAAIERGPSSESSISYKDGGVFFESQGHYRRRQEFVN